MGPTKTMITELKSPQKTAKIGEAGFIVIGERINPTRRKKLAEALVKGDMEQVKADAVEQVQAGAHVLDVNVGAGGIDEAATMDMAVRAVMSVADVPLCIDSAKPDALEAGLRACAGRALVNSVNADPEKLKTILPLVKKYNAAVIGLAYDDKGISDNPEVRLAAVKTIVDAAAEFGIAREDIVIDCLAFSLGTNHRSAAICLETMREVKARFDLNMVLGVSNVSFGVPNRSDVNTVFLSQCIANGLTCGIINPLDMNMMKAFLATELVLGRDKHSRNWNKFYRHGLALAEAAKAAAEGRQPTSAS